MADGLYLLVLLLAGAAVEPRAGGRWYERDQDGRQLSWGEVRSCEAPHRLVVAWGVSPERKPEPPDRCSEVEMRLSALGGGRTRLELDHRQLERHGDGAATLRDGLDSDQAGPSSWRNCGVRRPARAGRRRPGDAGPEGGRSAGSRADENA